LVQRYGPETAKRRLWNEEYATGRWDNLDDTGDENAHLLVEKYANKGSILDLGCGPGTTSIELNPAAYSFYTGLDISDVAIQKARRRAQESGHAGRNEYCQSDILTYEPVRQYNVILYGDSIYYIPPRQIVPMLYRYSTFLTQNGVIIARLFDVTGKRHDIVDNIQDHFDVVECHSHEQTLACLIVFRPRGTS
jgi:SAM-dependent methyltransferase